MKTRLALFTILSAMLLTAFGASSAYSADPENFRAGLTVTVTSCEGGNLPVCQFEGSAVVPQLGRVTVTGSIFKGCLIQFQHCDWGFFATLTPSGEHGGRILSIGGSTEWDPEQPAPSSLAWETREDLRYIGQGTATDDFSYSIPYGGQFTINLTGTLRPVH
jgi:hypothetical protein